VPLPTSGYAGFWETAAQVALLSGVLAVVLAVSADVRLVSLRTFVDARGRRSPLRRRHRLGLDAAAIMTL
jgi:hypothetical protein